MGKADVFTGMSLTEKLIWLKKFSTGGSTPTYEDRTATGNPVIFTTNFAQNAKALSASFSPKQNLNGYDHPWPDGTTKNLVGTGNLTWGKSINSSGVVVDYSANRCATVNPIMIDNTKSYVFSTGATDVRMIYAVFNGSTLVRRTSGTAGTPINVAGGDRVYLCFYTYSSTYDYRKVEPESDEIQFEQASTPTAYIPYGNVCPIDGFSVLTVTRTNKNLCPSFSGSESSSSNGITYTYGNDGSITASGTATGTSYSRNVRFDLKAGRYRKPQGMVVQEVVSSTYWTVVASESATDFTITDDIHALVRLKFVSGTTVNNETFYPYIYPYSVTDLSYEEQVTDDFLVSIPDGVGVVYGGTLTVNSDGSGALTVDTAEWTFDGTETPTNIGTLTNYYRARYNTANLAGATILNGVTKYSHGIIDNTYAGDFAHAYGTPSYVYAFVPIVEGLSVKQYMAAQAAANTPVQVTYKLATPSTYALSAEQIALLKGENVIATDGDNLSVTYQVKV